MSNNIDLEMQVSALQLHRAASKNVCSPLDSAKRFAAQGAEQAAKLFDHQMGRALSTVALRIRAVESGLLELFGRGKLHGTIHTCLGQEFTGAMLAPLLREGDIVTSNHRCHGHFIGATGNWSGLIDEIAGNARGVSAGIGSSQHLYASNFISNGLQGGLLPVAAGLALHRKKAGNGNVAISFIGEGTLGEGVLYETMNMGSLLGLPHLIVCENNFYSQSTPQQAGVAGNIAARAEAFGIQCIEADTWDPLALHRTAVAAIEKLRNGNGPIFLLVSTYRLGAHSKGDDQRDIAEVSWFNDHDPLNILLSHSRAAQEMFLGFKADVAAQIEDALTAPLLAHSEYFQDQLQRAGQTRWQGVPVDVSDSRMYQRLNAFYMQYLRDHGSAWFLGEDIADPYGGAFKIARGLTTAYPNRTFTTPISEAAIVGLGAGLAMAGHQSFVEIMFGDFMTLTVDQIVNNASKFFHMYNRKVSCPLVVRSPMGGRRGYGPTHSQSLERLFIGIDNCQALSLNSLVDPVLQLGGLHRQKSPVVLFENKVDYTLRLFEPPEGFVVEMDDAPYPTIRVRSEGATPNGTIFCYGGAARLICDGLMELFENADFLAEVIVPTSLYPLDIEPIAASVAATGRLIIVEEGPSFASVGAEVAAALREKIAPNFRLLRIGKHPTPIPSVPALEDVALPSVARVCREIERLLDLD